MWHKASNCVPFWVRWPRVKSSFQTSLLPPIGPQVGAPGITSVNFRCCGVRLNNGIDSS